MPRVVNEQQKNEQQLAAMRDSVWFINKSINENDVNDRTLAALDRNVRHLESMLSLVNIQSTEDFENFTSAIDLAKTFINEARK